MKQVLVELPDPLARRLERVAPSRQRKRATFIRQAIQRALDEIDEIRTEKAYRADPQDSGAEWFDASVWDEWATPKAKRPRKGKGR
jgi:predicted transcriptional regulator